MRAQCSAATPRVHPEHPPPGTGFLLRNSHNLGASANAFDIPSALRLFCTANFAMKTFSAKSEEVTHNWWVVDAQDQILGRLATKIADVLRGKNKAVYTPHCDTGDFVVVINASKVRVSGKKTTDKKYTSFSGYVGGHKSESFEQRRARRPELLVERAVRGMIPHNRLGRAQFTKLKVYGGAEHPHAAQQPKELKIA